MIDKLLLIIEERRKVREEEGRWEKLRKDIAKVWNRNLRKQGNVVLR